MDSVGFRGQHGIHLEPADKGDCADAGGTQRSVNIGGASTPEYIIFIPIEVLLLYRRLLIFDGLKFSFERAIE